VRNASISPGTPRTDRCGQGAVRVQRERDRSDWRENRGFAPEFRFAHPPVMSLIGPPATIRLTALFLGSTGTVAPGTLSLFLNGLPAVALGTWTGLNSTRLLSGAWSRYCRWPRASLSCSICARPSRFDSQPRVTLICASAALNVGSEVERVDAAIITVIGTSFSELFMIAIVAGRCSSGPAPVSRLPPAPRPGSRSRN
jgi:hypothetical protein